MRANYHTHTWRCNHATGVEEDYVRAAIEQKFDILGFSDHTPQFFPEGYRSGFRMGAEELVGYCSVVRQLQDRYRDKIKIHMGLEAEYYPALFSRLIPVLRDQGIEYLLLGQHFIGNEFGGKYNGWDTEEEDHLVTYVSQVLAGLDSGRFSYLAHPDLINFQGDEAILRREFARLAKGMAARGIPAEINLLGIRTRRHYPNRIFWEEAAKVGGIAAILGCDAHEPESVLDARSEEVALSLARELSIPVLETLELKKPF
jgi:histidinol-phosphatase (PHP family)